MDSLKVLINIVDKRKKKKKRKCIYHIYSKYSNRWVWANSVDPDQTPQNAASDQGLHCLSPIRQSLSLDSSTGNKLDSFQS